MLGSIPTTAPPLLPCHAAIMQAASAAYEKDADRFLTIARSFQCREVAPL